MMMRRASRSSTSRRRDRFNSADSLASSVASPNHNGKGGGGGKGGIRSRSQERSLSVHQRGNSILSPEYNHDDNEHSQADSTAGSNENLECFDVMLEDLDLVDGPSKTTLMTATSIGSGDASKSGTVIITTTTTTPNKNKPKSSSSILRKSSAHKYHRRSASDPFDISGLQQKQQVEDEEAAEETTSTTTTTSSSCEDGTSGSGGGATLPTLPRYPVAETRDLNCWSEPKVDIFKVRGKNYLKDKKKAPSDQYLLRARGCDLLLFPKEGGDSSSPSLLDRSDALLNGTLRKKPTLVLNFRFPWGLMLLHFEIPTKLVPFMHSNNNNNNNNNKPSLDKLSPGERTLALWLMGDTNYKNQRLKLIPFVVQGPWVVRNLVTGRPAIIGTKLPVAYQVVPGTAGLADLMVAELDIGNSSNTAKRIVSLCRRYMNALTCDIGFVIQANTEEELPEQMLGAIRIHGVDPLKAPTFV